jgi:hypothetical protein
MHSVNTERKEQDSGDVALTLENPHMPRFAREKDSSSSPNCVNNTNANPTT